MSCARNRGGCYKRRKEKSTHGIKITVDAKQKTDREGERSKKKKIIKKEKIGCGGCILRKCFNIDRKTRGYQGK